MNTLRRLLRHGDFRWLWLGQSLSEVGNRMIAIVVTLYVVKLTGSTGDVGIVLSAQAGALTLLLLLGGVVADRLPRRRVMIGADLARVAVQGIIAILAFTGGLSIWLLAVLVAGTGAAAAFFEPAYRGLLPQTVPEDMIQEALTLTQVSRNVALFGGSALGTGLALGPGFGWAYLVDAATFLASAGLLVFVRARVRGSIAELPAKEPLRRSLVDGLAEVRSRAWVWVTMLWALIFLFACLAPYFAVGAVVSRDRYGTSAVFGWLEAAAGAGALFGVFLGFRWRPRRPMQSAMMTPFIWTVAIALFSLGVSTWVVIPLMAIGGSLFTLFGLWWQTSLAAFIPPHAISRVSSISWVAGGALMPVGFVLAGFLGDHIAPTTVLTCGCIIGAVATAAALSAPGLRALRAGPVTAT